MRDFAKRVHANKGLVILINKDELGKSEWKNVIDYWVEGDCDEWVHDLKTRIPALWMKQEMLPVMPVIKPVSKKGISPQIFRAKGVAKVAVMTNPEDKENVMPMTPKKKVAQVTYQTTGGLLSPLSPTKRGLNANEPESPTKRLQVGKASTKPTPPPEHVIEILDD